MSSKKSRKLINIMLSAMMILGINATESYAAGTTEYGKNGVAYVLLSSDFSEPGVYRFNNYDGSLTEPWKLYKTTTITGKVSGLAANQNNEVFLLSATEGAEFTDAPIGWLPTGVKFPENSSVYLAVAGPSDGGAVDYWRDGYPWYHDWPSNGNPSSGQYWKRDQTYDGKNYEYAVNFGGPVGVQFLNGKDGATGCPIWDGSLVPSNSTTAAIPHPSGSTTPQRVILPSHVGALSYYLYGTKNEPAIEGKPMNGEDGRDVYIFTDANGAGVFTGDGKHGYGTMFGCIVRRFYQKRENSLNLYSGIDETQENDHPENQPMSQTQANVLKTVDVKVKEAYGKLCGDNCIDGGEIAGDDVELALSSVTVVTATTGNRYGFNPVGVFKGANDIDASLRVVKTNGNTQTIDIATDDDGLIFSNNITNRSYLNANGITPASIKTIGVSSKFGSNLDYIYGSGADYFVVQDSWWGKGGIAYEYYKGTDEEPGKIVKIDYMNNDNQTSSEELGDLTGNVDAIAIDGDGYLYALKTEESPLDSSMENISVSPSPNLTSITVNGSDLEATSTEWRRDIESSSSNGETINEGYIVIPDGQEEAGDYKIVSVTQNIYKAIKRYPQATGALGAEEDRGSLFAGHDTWINKLKRTSSGYTWDYPLWRQEEGTKVSSIRGELAVVNVADSPVSVPGTEKHYVMVTNAYDNDNNNMDYVNNQVIAEQNSLTFKVEGYKPKVNGEQRYFKDIGNIDGTSFSNVKLNSIPAEDGTYAHDEDGDGKKSGFPSSMFEATSFNTTVTWKIAQVEDTVAVSLGSAKLVSGITTLTGTGDYKSVTYKFNQPGRYIVQAVVTYNFFDNFGTAARPSNLTASTETFTTEPKLIQVYANSLNLNKSESYITDINIDTSDNKKSDYAVSGGTSDSNYDAVEGEASDGTNERKFGSITVSFNAQFVREEESNTSGNLQTYDGIGVWDYSYYKDLYTNAKINIPGITIPNWTEGTHAYNYVGNGDPATAYNPNVYNPGKVKGSASGDYTAGTKVYGEPSDRDKEFIQWALYLRPVTPQGDVTNEDNTILDRGDLIISGTCKNASFVPNGDSSNRNYKVTFTIDDIDSKINTPRDPKDYTLDLEIVYPRVTWLNNDLGAGLEDGHNYYSSIVPFTTTSNAAPVHVISRLNINDSTGTAINQSYEQSPSITDGDLYHKDSNGEEIKPYFTLCVRDKEKPVFSDKTANLPYYETTGDPTIPGEFHYEITDNNPFLSVKQFDNPYDANVSSLTVAEVKTGSDLLVQTLVENKFCLEPADAALNKKFEALNGPEKIAEIKLINEENSFYSNDSWRITASYTIQTDRLSSEIFAPGDNNTPEKVFGFIDNKYYILGMENWVGTLNYAVVGKFYDGLGKDGNYTAHYLYDPEVYSAGITGIEGYPTSLGGNELTETIEIDEKDAEGNQIVNKTQKPYLERIDNDPPSIEVELVSQSDNRRWVFQLVEGINDVVSCAKTVENLAPSHLIVKEYYLKSASNDENVEVTPFEPVTVPGTTNYYDLATHDEPPEGCVATATVTDYIPAAVPSFRRASRLLINVKIFDNCGYLPLNTDGGASIKVTNNGNPILEKMIKEDASHDAFGNMKEEFQNKPRGIFAVDLPMQVGTSQSHQLEVSVFAKDKQGNQRTLIIPVDLVESSFETRILETQENRQ